MILVWILGATLIVSVISLIGVLTFIVNKKFFDKILILLVGFATGGLLGSAFFHLLPEAIEKSSPDTVFFYTLIGFTGFFLMEKYVYWRHCHSGVCEVHAFTYLNLIGDGVHNFTDGLIIAASFMTDIKLGIVTTLAVVFHEIPQELGDFGILVHGGFSKSKALLCNFICALAAVVGAIIGYALVSTLNNISFYLIAFTAGGFIYIAASDLIPEIHRQSHQKSSNAVFVAFIMGLVFMFFAKTWH